MPSPRIESSKRWDRPVFAPPPALAQASKAARRLRVDGAGRNAPGGELGDLAHGVESLVLDRFRGEARRVRRRDHVGPARELERGHLVRRTPNVDRGARDAPLLERPLERRLIDQIAARQIDEERTRLHLRESRGVHQILGFLGRDGEAYHEVGFGEQRVERRLTDAGRRDGLVRVADDHLHAERLADRREISADDAIADDPQGGALELTSGAGLRSAALAINERRARDVAREIDHEPERHFGNGGGKAGRRPGHQDTLRARRRHVDVADIDRAAQERDERTGRVPKESRRPRGLPVRHDDLAAARRLRQRIGVENPPGRIDPHLGMAFERRHGARAIIVLQHVRGVGEKHAGHGLFVARMKRQRNPRMAEFVSRMERQRNSGFSREAPMIATEWETASPDFASLDPGYKFAHSSRARPLRNSTRASSASLSSLPVSASRSIFPSKRAASNLLNQARNFASSSAPSLETARLISSILPMQEKLAWAPKPYKSPQSHHPGNPNHQLGHGLAEGPIAGVRSSAAITEPLGSRSANRGGKPWRRSPRMPRTTQASAPRRPGRCTSTTCRGNRPGFKAARSRP